MANEADIALAALIIDLSALLIALGQLLQQAFSTADGYRRYQASVIGPWSKRTRRVWHWSQFRFETKFTTPDIVLIGRQSLINHPGVHDSKTLNYKGTQVVDLCGSNQPTELREAVTQNRDDSGHQILGDMVTWILFLRQFNQLQKRWYQAYQPYLLSPKDRNRVVGLGTTIGVICQERTWDLLPPDTTRPMASSRLGTIIILALRLGMRSENFDAIGGVMQAEGNGHALFSTTIRGLGIVFQYNFNSGIDSDRGPPSLFSTSGFESTVLIPRRAIDKMSCEIIPSTGFDIPDIPLQGKKGCSQELGITLSRI